MAASAYDVPAASIEVELEVKKSRFITRVGFAPDREAAMAILAKARDDYPDARHHCWAYLVGNPHSPRTVAASDDGEPSGTAGKPILNVLQHKQIGDLMVVVIRYFGGIKLGAGGLVRAYSSAAQQGIDALTLREQRFLVEFKVRGDYALEQSLRHWLVSHSGELVSVDYQQHVDFTLNLEPVYEQELEDFVVGQKGQLIRDHGKV